MNNKRNGQTEVDAAKERLAKFCRLGYQSKNRHDPERLRRFKQGQQNTSSYGRA